MKRLLTAAVAAQFLDLVTFIVAATVVGIWGEVNPIIRSLYGTYGVEGVVLYKGSLIVAMLLILMWLSTLSLHKTKFMMWFVIVVSVVASASNVAAVLLWN